MIKRKWISFFLFTLNKRAFLFEHDDEKRVTKALTFKAALASLFIPLEKLRT